MFFGFVVIVAHQQGNWRSRHHQHQPLDKRSILLSSPAFQGILHAAARLPRCCCCPGNYWYRWFTKRKRKKWKEQYLFALQAWERHDQYLSKQSPPVYITECQRFMNDWLGGRVFHEDKPNWMDKGTNTWVIRSLGKKGWVTMLVNVKSVSDVNKSHDVLTLRDTSAWVRH